MPPLVIEMFQKHLQGLKKESPLQVEDPFEDFAAMLQAPATLRAATRFLQRLALKLRLATTAAGSAGVESLLKRLFPKVEKPDRYPARVFLCAYMILSHPQVRHIMPLKLTVSRCVPWQPVNLQHHVE